MHIGRSDGPDRARPFLHTEDGSDGARSADGLCAGTYAHGLFAADGFRHAFLDRLKRRHDSGLAYEVRVEATLDRLAEHLETHLDMDGLLRLAGLDVPTTADNNKTQAKRSTA
jgi:adenosylcobyric acid synthase